MTRLVVYAALGLVGMLVAGCGGQAGSSGSSGTAPAHSQAGAKPQQQKADANKGNVFAPLENDVQKARGVQDTVNQQAERLRKQIEKEEGAEDKDD
ncbi:MAG TPA: hypothetical protein VFY39_12980 [Gammaproteobacteria bacterium]|nr:hypothetical protein [Gammaproteobacteria bacterium]